MIYTAITNSKDKPREDIKVFSDYNHFVIPVMNAKIYKVLPHLFFSGNSIWVDGNIFPKEPEWTIFKAVPYDCDLAFFAHPCRQNVTEEARALITLGIGISTVTEDFLEKNLDALGHGLFDASVVLRRDSDRVRRFNECWWSLICP